MSEEFKQATDGRFEITVYSGGTQGDESMFCGKCGSMRCRPVRSRTPASG